LTSLKNVHKIVKKIDGAFGCDGNKIKSHVLGVLLIEGCRLFRIDNNKVEDIVNKYLKEPMSKQRMIDCQNELIDAGFEEYAQL
jgi:hypothetical protein